MNVLCIAYGQEPARQSRHRAAERERKRAHARHPDTGRERRCGLFPAGAQSQSAPRSGQPQIHGRHGYAGQQRDERLVSQPRVTGQRSRGNELPGRAEQFAVQRSRQAQRKQVDDHAHHDLIGGEFHGENGEQESEQQARDRAGHDAGIRVVHRRPAAKPRQIQCAERGRKCPDKQHPLQSDIDDPSLLYDVLAQRGQKEWRGARQCRLRDGEKYAHADRSFGLNACLQT